MNNLFPQLVFLVSEKVSSDNLFEGFSLDLESTADLVKSLSDYNPTVWAYMTAVTEQVMRPIGVAILALILILEFSKLAKKIAGSGGAMTIEAIAPMIVSFIMVGVVMANTTVIVEAILGLAGHALSRIAGVVAQNGQTYDTLSGLKGFGTVGKMIIAFFALLIWLVRMASAAMVNLMVTSALSHASLCPNHSPNFFE